MSKLMARLALGSALIALAAPAAMAQGDSTESSYRVTQGPINPAMDRALAELHAMQNLCNSGQLSGSSGAEMNTRFARIYGEVSAEANGMEQLAETTEDLALSTEYLAQSERLFRELMELPDQLKLNCNGEDEITMRFSDGDTYVVPDMGRILSDLSEDTSTGNPDLEKAPVSAGNDEPDWYLGFSYSSQWARSGQTGIGFQRDGGPGEFAERYASETPNEIHYHGAQIDVRRGALRLAFEYFEGDGEATGFSSGTVTSGNVYGDLFNGSSGVSAGADTTSRVEEESLTWAIGFGYQFEFSGGKVESGGPSVSATPFVEFRRDERDFRGQVDSSVTLGGFTFEYGQTREQFTSQDSYGLGVKLDVSWETSYGLGIGFTGSFGGYRYESELDSLEVNTNNFTGAPEDNFAIDIDEDDSGFGVEAGLGIWASYDLGGGASFVTGAAYEYRSSTAAVYNPRSGDEVFFDGLSTGLQQRSSDTVVVRGGFVFEW